MHIKNCVDLSWNAFTIHSLYSLYTLFPSSHTLLPHTETNLDWISVTGWLMWHAPAFLFPFLSAVTFISPVWTCCTVLIQSRNMNRCDVGNLSIWPGAVVGQKWAAQLSLKLKSNPERLAWLFVGDPKGVAYFSNTMASKPNSANVFDHCLISL